MTTLPDNILNALASANGRRRMRTLDSTDVIQVLDEALRTGQGHRAGRTVANAYSYPACRTAAFAARRTDGNLAVAIDTVNARKGTVGLPGEVGNGNTMRRRDWADIRTIWADGAELVVPRRLALALVAERRRTARLGAHGEILRSLARYTVSPDTILVTREHSLRAGNCADETERIAGWFRERESVTAAELLAAIEHREPALARYALRAVEMAAQSQGVSA